MKRKTTKTNITISVHPELNNIMKNNFKNRSQYIEWLIYQDLLKNRKDDDNLKKIII